MVLWSWLPETGNFLHMNGFEELLGLLQNPIFWIQIVAHHHQKLWFFCLECYPYAIGQVDLEFIGNAKALNWRSHGQKRNIVCVGKTPPRNLGMDGFTVTKFDDSFHLNNPSVDGSMLPIWDCLKHPQGAPFWLLSHFSAWSTQGKCKQQWELCRF